MPHTRTYKRSLPLALLLLLGVVWGTGYSIARYAMTHGVNPLGYSFWLSLGPAILITGLTLLKRIPIPLTYAHYRYYLICGLSGIVLPNTMMYFAAPHLPAGILAVVVNTVPLFAYPMALLTRTETFSYRRCLALTFALSGLMLILIPQTSLPSPHMIPWIINALFTPLCFAFCSVYISRYRPAETHTLALTAGTLMCSTLLLMPFILGGHYFYAFHTPFQFADYIVCLEILLSSLGYILFFTLIKIAGPVYYSFVDTIVAITGLFWGYLLFNENLNVWTGSSVLLILIALILISTRPRRMIN